ncbi:hypothetical protein C2E20_6185 isoform B [Micractinium conductrix]|uniref:Uncharacterized protein n=1 Tax=Micractinium conductrix TaxID=554055 RepID=A0A2P6V8R7_9CHLO|nr:hypothetical protein C2E20_6185 isoform B [Micractinium conductrix]|eukprot:PSC70473.1 hypothetical protein C2E20_6185 isoform B [Micractinium conductrix]
MLAAVARPGLALRTGSFQTARVQRRSLVCRASAEEPRQWHEKLALPAAALLGAALLFAATPDEAEAARSGGRVGGSSGFSSRRAAPAPSTSAPRVTNNVIVTSPPVFGGYGMGMPMFGGFGFYPVFGFGLGTIFNIMLIGIAIQVVLSVVSGFTNSRDKKSFDDDKW